MLLHMLVILVFPLAVALLAKKPDVVVGFYAIIPTPLIAYYAQAVRPDSMFRNVAFSAAFAGFLELWLVVGFFVVPRILLGRSAAEIGGACCVLHGVVVFLLTTAWLTVRWHLQNHTRAST